jgi:hypothetical protein
MTVLEHRPVMDSIPRVQTTGFHIGPEAVRMKIGEGGNPLSDRVAACVVALLVLKRVEPDA